MNRLYTLYHRLIEQQCHQGGPLPTDLLEDLIEELRQAMMPLDDDAVCFVLAVRLWGGTIAQLTHDVDDPGFVNRATGATEGFSPRDLCGSSRRKDRGMATAVRVWEPEQFLAQDPTGTRAARAQLFEDILIGLIEQKLAALD